MTRSFVALSAALALTAFGQEGAEASPAKPKLTVVPFAALTGEVPQRAGAKAVGMLTTELKSADSFVLVEAPKDKSALPADDALAPARSAVAEAQALRGKKKFRLAEEALLKALTSYKASAAALSDIGEVADAYALLAAIQYNTGRDEEGLKSLWQALTLAPGRELPLAQTSALFARLVAENRKALAQAPQGSLVVESSPSNAPILLDGLPLGSSPLAIKEVPPGLHFWKANLPSGETIGGVAEVSAGKAATAKASSSSKDPESRLLSVLAQNKLDAELATAAGEQAKACDADFLVFGALSTSGKGLALDTFLYTKSTKDIRRMARTSFDAELLSAGMEFFSLAGELTKKGDQVGEAVKLPSSVSTSLLPGAAGTLTEAKYGLVPGKEAGLEGLEPGGGDVKEEGPRKPLDQKRRGPLKRQ